jgi:multidrug efflux pump
MNVSAPFIRRPIATLLLSIGLALTGLIAVRFLAVGALPSIDIPVIVVFAGRPGADPETMASSIAAPLERRLGEIPGVDSLTSVSSTGSTSIIVSFTFDRDIEGAARDVQAAINAATTDLPSDLPTRPFYRKFNPAEAPILTLSLTSPTLPVAQMFDAADTVLAQRLSQVDGVGQVQVSGAEKPAVRVQLDPAALKAAGLSSQAVLTAIRNANVDGPIGETEGPARAETLVLNNQISRARDYADLVVKAAPGGAVVRLRDVAHVEDGVANSKLAAWEDKQPAILLTITKAPGANVLATIERLKAALPQLMSWVSPEIHLTVLSDRTATIRASVNDVVISLMLSVALVLLVVLLFMRRLVPTLATAATVPLSLSATLASMWFQGFSLDNFSIMALTISVGFVVDDAIVMIENIVRLQERGLSPMQAALVGSRQIGFTVISISLSLVAVFFPILFMGGILGRLFHEFATVITVAILVSAAVSLTLTPMLCGRFARLAGPPGAGPWGRVDRAVEGVFAAMLGFYARTLGWALRHRRFMVGVTLATIVATVVLYREVPKGFLPTQDTGLLVGGTNASPDISFDAMAERQRRVVDVLLADPAVENVGSTIGVTAGWSSLNRGQLTVQLKPLAERGISSEKVIARLRPQLQRMAGVETNLYSGQDLRGGGGDGGSASFQFVLLGDDIAQLREWTSKMEDALHGVPGIEDATSDQDKPGPEARVVVDRDAAARLGVKVQDIDDALNNAYAQRQGSIIYTERNQYRVVVETDPRLQRDPTQLDQLYVPGTGGAQVPLLAVTRLVRDTAPLAIRHQQQFPAASISFNLLPGTSQSAALAIVQRTADALRLPPGIRTSFAGNAKWLQQSAASEPFLILAALLSIYIVLGVLYESLIHPLTILSTLPSAGLGALLAVLVTGTEMSLLSIIGIVLLMGIVKKNGIIVVDFALEAQRERGLTPEQAVLEACLERFRPIMMTTLAAFLGAVPLALATGTGAEYRVPLGIAICGGLLVSQALTLYTTPVIYLALERLTGGKRARIVTAPAE